MATRLYCSYGWLLPLDLASKVIPEMLNKNTLETIMSNLAVKPQASYPALIEMGVTRFDEISHYSLRSEGPDTDVLRIYYERKKGSFLPQSRKYQFGRSMNTTVADGGTARMERTYEISPFLLTAINELDFLVAEKTSSGPVDDVRSEEIHNLSIVLDELDALESWVSEVAGDEHAAEVTRRFSALKKFQSV